nr:hypothetical protein [Tanacetum cinerariifolium]
MSRKSKGKEAEPTGDVTLRWSSDEEALYAECYVAVSEDRNVGRSQAKDTFWVRVMHEFNRYQGYVDEQMDDFEPSLPKVQRNLQKVPSFEKKWRERAWAILRQHTKWDAPEVAPVDLTEDETGDFHATVTTDELFGADPRPRPPGKQRPGKKTKSDASASTGGSQLSQFGEFVSHELRLKREAAKKAFEASKDKDETIKSLEELRFRALSTKDLSDDDAYWIERKKAQIKAKLRAEMPMEPNNEDDSDE